MTTTAVVINTDEVCRVMRTHNADGKDMYGWQVHRNIEDPSHVLITCDTSDNWLPGPAVPQAVAPLIREYAASLRDAGFGTATWKHEILIVAPTQEHADAIAPAIRAYLSELNPDA